MSSAPAADHVLDVLALLSRQPEPVSAGTVAARLDLPRSTTYRLLAVLTDRGYVSYLPEERRYGLGVAAYEIGSAYQRQAPLQRMARPILHALADQLTQNAHLSVLQGRDVLYLIEERAVGRPLLITDVGVRLPAVVTASGLAMLARLTAAQLRAVFPDATAFHADAGPRTPTALRRMLTDVRLRWNAVEQGPVSPGLSSVAQAVVDHTGHPVASIAVTFAEVDVSPAAVRDLVRAVQTAADRLSRRLGARPDRIGES